MYQMRARWRWRCFEPVLEEEDIGSGGGGGGGIDNVAEKVFKKEDINSCGGLSCMEEEREEQDDAW